MPLDQPTLLSALRGSRSLDDICTTAGVTRAEFLGARDALMHRLAAIGDQRIAGPVGKPVEILRDRAGIPHVFASRTDDLYFGLGVAMAQDRLWQMDRLRRRALGRQAEILGAAYVASDIAHLTVGLDEMAEREPAQMDGETHGLIAAFVAGINRQIAVLGKDLPIRVPGAGLRAPRPSPSVTSWRSRAPVVVAERPHRPHRGGRGRALLPTEALRNAYLTPEASENLVLPAGMPAGMSAGPTLAAGSDDAPAATTGR